MDNSIVVQVPNNYLTDMRIISGRNIYEYDIKQANINVLYSKGIITPDEYKRLVYCPKYDREIIVGKMIRENSKLGEVIRQGIIEAKRLLLDNNHLDIESNVVRIANDAVYVMSSIPLLYTTFDIGNSGHYVEFIIKNHFTSFIRFNNKISVFIKANENNELNIEVIGLGVKVSLHGELLSFIGKILIYLERSSRDLVVNEFNSFYDDYINLRLDIGYYRELQPLSVFRLKDKRSFNISPTTSNGLKVEDLNIEYNLHILRELYSAIISL